MAPELKRIGLLTRIDRAALASYCDWYSHWVIARNHISKEGILLDDKKHPAVTVAKKSLVLMRSFMSEFGMTPSSRSRISVEVEEDHGYGYGFGCTPSGRWKPSRDKRSSGIR